MTENEVLIKTPEEAIETIKSNMPTSGYQMLRESLNMAIIALKEVQQYREIGTVEECREAVEKKKAKKCDVTKDNFRIYYKCPTCNHCLRVEYNHGSWMGKKSKNCSKCGQAIQWEESEEE